MLLKINNRPILKKIQPTSNLKMDFNHYFEWKEWNDRKNTKSLQVQIIKQYHIFGMCLYTNSFRISNLNYSTVKSNILFCHNYSLLYQDNILIITQT